MGSVRCIGYAFEDSRFGDGPHLNLLSGFTLRFRFSDPLCLIPMCRPRTGSQSGGEETSPMQIYLGLKKGGECSCPFL